jgi:hypothetical protein
MRRRTVGLLLGVSLAASGLNVAAPSASAASPGVLWAGNTRDGGRVYLRTVRRDGVRHVVYFQADVSLTCDGTDEVLEMAFATVPGAPVVDGSFLHDQVLFNTASHLAGGLGTDQGRGTFSVAMAGFTPEERTQRCDMPTTEWKVHRRPAPSAIGDPSGMRVEVRDGAVAVSSEGSSAGMAAGEPIRPWFGETRQRFPIFIETIGRPGARRIGTYEIGAFAPCPTSPYAVALFILGYADLPLDHGSWRIDEVSLFVATHWVGRLANSAGHGTLQMSLPAFAADGSIEVCTSGEVPWRAHPEPVAGHTLPSAAAGLSIGPA